MESLDCTPQPTLSHELRAIINQRNILTAKSKSKVLHALDKQIEENKSKRQLDFRNKVIDEIFTSEVSYLRQLEIIMKFFKEPLERSTLMSAASKRSLFGNIESIYKVNGELVNQLKTQENNVGAAFLYLAPFFKLYSMYAYDYKNGLTLLQEVTKQNSKLSVWLRSQECRPEVGSRLSALLIAPIQRLPRYRLLLRQLLSLTPASHPHHTTLTEAVNEVEKATAHIDSLVFKQETHARLVTLQHCLVGSKPSIVAPNTRLIKEGVLMKMSANGQKAQRRYFILMSDNVVYCKLTGRENVEGEGSRPTVPGSLHCCAVLPISKCTVESVLTQAVFNLTCRAETYILFSEHREHAMEWVDAISNTISQYRDNLKTLRKKSSSRHPLHLNRKRKFRNENELTMKEVGPAKKAKTDLSGCQGIETDDEEAKEELMTYQTQKEADKNGYLQSIKSVLQSFGESVRQYIYPGSAYR